MIALDAIDVSPMFDRQLIIEAAEELERQLKVEELLTRLEVTKDWFDSEDFAVAG